MESNGLRQEQSAESSTEESDLEMEEDSPEKVSTKKPKTEAWQVPSIDLWVPTRHRPPGIPGELASVTLLSKGFDVNRKRKPVRGALLVAENDQASEDLQPRTSPSLQIQAKEGLSVEGTRISRTKKDSWRVSLAYVKCVLRRNGYELQKRNRERSRKQRFTSSQRDLIPPASGQRYGICKMTLTRRLMMAVSPWAGKLVQAWALRVKKEASRNSKAEFILKHLQMASIKSTPLFTLFIQLLSVDVHGCMKVIQKRKSRQLEVLKAVAGNPGGTKQASPAQDPAVPLKLRAGSSKNLVPLKAKDNSLPAQHQPAFLPPRPALKPKTVSELLREKRLQEWKAKRALPKRAILAPLLLPSPSLVVIQPPVGPPAQAGCGGLPTAANGLPLSSISPLGAPAPLGPSVQEPMVFLKGSKGEETSSGSKKKPCGKEGNLLKESQGVPAAATSVPLLPKQSHLPPQILAAKLAAPVASLSPTSIDPGPKKAPSLAPAAHALVALPPGSSEVTNHFLPVTWLLTAQGLIPTTFMNLPSQEKQPRATSSLGTSPGLSQVAEAVPGSAGPVTAGQQLQGAASSTLQKNEQPNPTCSSVLHTPAASTELQCTLPPACPLVPLLPSPSMGNLSLADRNRAHLTPEPQNQVVRNSPHPVVAEGIKVPLEKAHPSRAILREEEITLDYRLLSLEGVAAVKEWAKCCSGPRAPSLDARLPYLPPFLCNLKTLSMLLLKKAALEQMAARLVAREGQREANQQLDLNAVREVVRQRLQDNPAYQLLKARFLAAFAFPAALAALPPSRVTTTLSGRRWHKSRCKEDSSSTSSSEEEEDDDDRETEKLKEPDIDRTGMPGVRKSTRLRRQRRHL